VWGSVMSGSVMSVVHVVEAYVVDVSCESVCYESYGKVCAMMIVVYTLLYYKT